MQKGTIVPVVFDYCDKDKNSIAQLIPNIFGNFGSLSKMTAYDGKSACQLQYDHKASLLIEISQASCAVTCSDVQHGF